MSSEHLFDTTGSGQDLRGSALHEARHLVIGTVPAADLDKPVSRPDIVAIGPGRHVAVQQHIRQQRVGGRELRRQLGSKAPDVSFDVSARVIRHQAHNLAIDVHSAEVTRPIERVETSLNQVGGVPDVVKPGRCHESIRQRQLLGGPPSPSGDRPHMPPTAGQGIRQIGLGKVYSTADVDHGLDFTHETPVGPTPMSAAVTTLDEMGPHVIRQQIRMSATRCATHG
jgi:hypothetical protein